jgi:hypothetical protein
MVAADESEMIVAGSLFLGIGEDFKMSLRLYQAMPCFGVLAANADFTFLPARLYVERATAKEGAERGTNKTPRVAKPGEMQDWFARRASRRFVPNNTSFVQAMGVREATAAVISPRAKTAINGYSMVAVAKPDEDHPVDQISFSLNYDPQEGDGGSIPADPPVVLNNTNAAQTSWPHPDNCQDLALDKLAS